MQLLLEHALCFHRLSLANLTSHHPSTKPCACKSPAFASAVMASSQATDGNVILIDDARCEEMDLSYYDYGSAGELRDNVGEDGTRMHDDYSSTVSSKKSTVEPILILGESEPRMQRLGVTCPRVRHHARVFADKIAQRVRGLTLDPLSPIIHQVKMSDHRDDTVTYVVYAVHNKHGKLLKIGLASNLKTRNQAWRRLPPGVPHSVRHHSQPTSQERQQEQEEGQHQRQDPGPSSSCGMGHGGCEPIYEVFSCYLQRIEICSVHLEAQQATVQGRL